VLGQFYVCHKFWHIHVYTFKEDLFFTEQKEISVIHSATSTQKVDGMDAVQNG